MFHVWWEGTCPTSGRGRFGRQLLGVSVFEGPPAFGVAGETKRKAVEPFWGVL